MVGVERRLPENARLRERVNEMLERGTSELVPMRDGVNIHVDRRGYRDLYRKGDGTEVMYMHGTPFFGGAVMPRHIQFYRRGLEVFSPTRRGYFVSPRKPHRDFEVSADDAADVLSYHGIKSSYLVTKSGGIGHGLKFAAKYPDLVKGVAVIAGALSPDMMGEEWAEGMAKANAEIVPMSDESLYNHIGEQARLILNENTNRETGQMLQHIPPRLSDLARRDIWNSVYEWDFQDTYRMALLRGHGGWYDDARMLYHDWGFDLRDVKQPVQLYYYESDDYAPPAHGRRLQELLPNAQLRVIPGSHFRTLSDIFTIIHDLKQVA